MDEHAVGDVCVGPVDLEVVDGPVVVDVLDGLDGDLDQPTVAFDEHEHALAQVRQRGVVVQRSVDNHAAPQLEAAGIRYSVRQVERRSIVGPISCVFVR